MKQRLSKIRIYLTNQWSAFAWLHLVPQEIRDRYKRTLVKCDDYDREVQRLRLICDDIEQRSEFWRESAEKWEEAYRFMCKAYDSLLKEGAAH